jgi:hypothetical protein
MERKSQFFAERDGFAGQPSIVFTPAQIIALNKTGIDRTLLLDSRVL